MDEATQNQLLQFWFGEPGPKGEVHADKQSRWWKKSDDFDNLCREQFEPQLKAASAGTLEAPTDSARGGLAYIILCDQLSRNMYRDTPGAFASDPLALAVTQRLIATGMLDDLSPVEKSFALMPLMHCEELSVQEQSIEQFAKLKKEGKDNLGFAEKHKVIIDRFGRYPHRNSILGRESTSEEISFLTESGSSF